MSTLYFSRNNKRGSNFFLSKFQSIFYFVIIIYYWIGNLSNKDRDKNHNNKYKSDENKITKKVCKDSDYKNYRYLKMSNEEKKGN